MSFLNRFIKGVSDSPSFGSAASRGLRKRDARPPNTMVGWKIYVDELPRSERSRQYPGMHKDLIPTFEMIMSKGLGGRPVDRVGSMSRRNMSQSFRAKSDEEIAAENPECRFLKQEAKQLHQRSVALQKGYEKIDEEISSVKYQIEVLKKRHDL